MLLKRLVTVVPLRFRAPSSVEFEASTLRELDYDESAGVVRFREQGVVVLIVPRDSVLCMEPLPEPISGLQPSKPVAKKK